MRSIALFFLVALVVLAPVTATAQSRALTEAYREGAALYRDGRPEEAIPHIERALTLSEEEFGRESSRTAFILNNLGVLYRTVGRHAAAAPVLTRALRILDRSLGPDHSLAAQVVNELSIVYVALGDYERAEPMLTRFLDQLESTAGPDDPRIATAAYNLAYARQNLGRAAAARDLYRRAHDIWNRTVGPANPDTQAAAERLAALEAEQPTTAAEPREPDVPAERPESRALPRQAYAEDRPAAPVSGKTWRVQVASLPSQAEAEREANRIRRAHGDKLEGRAPAISQANLEKGTYFRVILGPFETLAPAQSLCRRLREDGQACFVAAHDT